MIGWRRREGAKEEKPGRGNLEDGIRVLDGAVQEDPFPMTLPI